MADKKIFGRWGGYQEMAEDWFDSEWNAEAERYDAKFIPNTFPKEDEILFASYGGGAYEGDATIIWQRDGKLYEAHGSHCSCHGLEGQFEPEETTLQALANKGKKDADSYYYFLSDHEGDAYVAYWNLIDRLQAVSPPQE